MLRRTGPGKARRRVSLRVVAVVDRKDYRLVARGPASAHGRPTGQYRGQRPGPAARAAPARSAGFGIRFGGVLIDWVIAQLIAAASSACRCRSRGRRHRAPELRRARRLRRHAPAARRHARLHDRPPDRRACRCARSARGRGPAAAGADAHGPALPLLPGGRSGTATVAGCTTRCPTPSSSAPADRRGPAAGPVRRADDCSFDRGHLPRSALPVHAGSGRVDALGAAGRAGHRGT